MQVAMDRRHVTFMYSYPNYIPMRPADIRHIQSRLHGCEFVDLFGFSARRNIIGGAREAVNQSFDRYFKAISE